MTTNLAPTSSSSDLDFLFLLSKGLGQRVIGLVKLVVLGTLYPLSQSPLLDRSIKVVEAVGTLCNV